jgi:phage terminase large subunit GpA-like protein
VWTPPPRLKLSEWADEKRRLSAESSAETGRWRTDRAEYQRAIMDAFVNPDVEIITWMSSAQVGKTEVLNNVIGYFVDQDASPMLMVRPTLDDAMAWSKDRFAPMIRDNDCLRGKVADAKAKDSGNTILHKTFPGGHLTVVGANSPAGLASRPIRILLFDEVDKYPASAGTEGDPIKLGKKRSQTFWNRKIGITSTPTIKGISRVEASFNESNKQFFHVPCPKCNHFQRLVFSQVKWEKREDGTNDFDSVHYECVNCTEKLFEPDKLEMVRNGNWVAERPEVIKHAGFHLSELYSPWSSWKEIVIDFLEAKKRKETLKVWINTTLGETFEDEESLELSGGDLLKRREGYVTVPEGVYLLTASVDVQDDRLEAVVKGWGMGDESWFIAKEVFYGSPGRSDPWGKLLEFLTQEFPAENGLKMKVACTAVDSGGHFTQSVYKFTKSNIHLRIFAVKGYAGYGKSLIGKASKNNKVRALLIPIGVDTAKEIIYDRLKIEEHGAGYMHFNQKCDEEYFNQLTAEKQITKYNKGFATKVWVVIESRRNEMLDCEVYNLAAYHILKPNMEVLSESIKSRVKELKRQKESGIISSDTASDPEGVLRDQKRSMKRVGRKNFVTSWRN